MDFCLTLRFLLLWFLITSKVKGGKKKPGGGWCPQDCRCERIKGHGLEADCKNMNLDSIPQTFSERKQWKYVDLSINNISQIEENSFNHLLLVESLQLTFNRISQIHPSSFKRLHKLLELKLQGNCLTTIPPRLFSNSPNIQLLKLDANAITNITAESFIGLHNLQYLHLDNNLLKAIPVGALRETPKLEVLSLSVNKIETIPDDAFSLLSELLVLNLRENSISRIGDRAMDSMKFCSEIDLSFNLLTEYPKTITRLKELAYLSINDNLMKVLPNRAFAQQRNLQTLFLHNNRLTLVGRWTFTHLHLIKKLNLDGLTEQEYFPDLSGCASLEELSVTGGNVFTLPRDLCGPDTKLHTLNIANNMLYNLSGVNNCYNLKKLDARGNAFSSLQTDEIKNLTMLTDLNLSGNKITFIADEAFEKTRLRRLNLAQNPFSMLPALGLSKVTYLNVSNCHNLLYLPPKELLDGLQDLEATYAYHCCQMRKQISQEKRSKGVSDNKEIRCSPKPGPLTPCYDLLNLMVVRVFLWIVLIISVVLNFSILLFNATRTCVASYKQMHNELTQTTTNEDDESEITEIKKYVSTPSSNGNTSSKLGAFEIALCHLAFADLITSIYVGIIVSYDAQTQGDFSESGAWWQQCVSCKAAGFFLVMGLQLAFFTILTAAVERYLSTMFPLNPEKHIGRTVMVLNLNAAWVIAIATAVVTLYSGNERTSGLLESPLPSYNGATCFPWSTDFPYVAVLVVAHVIACAIVVFLCSLMYCAKRKQSWLSAQKNTRRQITLTASCNVLLILPLALIGLLTSAIATYPSSTEPWIDKENFAQNTGQLNIDVLLLFVMLLLSLRLLLNPILYIIFSEVYRNDCKNLLKRFSCSNQKHSFYDDDSDDEGNTPELAATEFAYTVGATFSPLEEYTVLQTVPVHFVSSPEENFSQKNLFCERQVYRDITEVDNDEDHAVISDEEVSSDEEYNPMLHNSPLQKSGQNMSEDVSSTNWNDGLQPVRVFQDYRSDPFCISNHSQADDSHPQTSELLPSSQRVVIRNIDKSKSCIYESDVPGPSQPDTSLYNSSRKRPKYWSAVVQESKKRLPPLTLQKYSTESQALYTIDGQILLQSCESSTSKDSGIQSEPDFGAGIACSSGCSTLSRSGKKCNENTVPMILVHSQPGGNYALENAEPQFLKARPREANYKVMRSIGKNKNNIFYISHSNIDENERVKLKTETVL